MLSKNEVNIRDTESWTISYGLLFHFKVVTASEGLKKTLLFPVYPL